MLIGDIIKKFGSVIKPINMLVYTSTTWAEWTKDSGVVGDSTGLEFTADGTNYHNAMLPNTTFKANTKYGFLYNIVNSNFSSFFRTGSNVFTYAALPKTVGYQKTTATSNATITLNRLEIQTSNVETSGNKIKIKDIRIFELPIGSQIEADFTNLTADQLNTKYPY